MEVGRGAKVKKRKKNKDRLNNSMSDISEITMFFFSKILLKCFPIEFFKNFNGFEKINKIQIWSKLSKLTIYAYKGVICRVKVKKEDFFELFWGKSWSKEPPVTEKGV